MLQYGLIALVSLGLLCSAHAASPATATETADAVTLDNGLMQVVLRKQTGQIVDLHALVKGKLQRVSDEKARSALYLDWNASQQVIPPELKDKQPRAGYGGPKVEKVWLVSRGPDAVEVAISAGAGPWSPFAAEYHYRLPRGERKLYAWVRYVHSKGMPAGNIGQTRLVFRGVTGTRLFTHHIVDETRMNPFPTSPVIETVQDATTLHADGTYYTKYDNSAFTRDYVAHGLWGNGLGVWVLWPSLEFCNGGPLRQDLTVHPDNVVLAMFQSGHFGAGPITFADDEEWSKFCGPVVFYLNEASSPADALADATRQTSVERAQWPYAWVNHGDYPTARGTVCGKVQLATGKAASNAWVVLSPEEEIDWARSARGYQFFATTAADGSFEISRIRPGKYKINVSGADQPVDYQQSVDVSPGSANELGTLLWKPATHGRKLWQVGSFDRGTTEFLMGDQPRNYARFLDYFRQFPEDITFTAGKSSEKSDWFYAHWNWFNKTPRRSIRFQTVTPMKGVATLTVGIASREYARATSAKDVADRATASGKLVVRLNGEQIAEFSGAKTGAAGYRSASQDSQYVVETVTFDATRIKRGENEISFEHAVSRKFPTDAAERKALRRPEGSVMYDAIRLEVAE